MRISILLLMTGLLFIPASDAQNVRDNTCFQTASPYNAFTDIGSDVAIVYGINESFPARVAKWRDEGYTASMMTGISWGDYGDYYMDTTGRLKVEEIQTTKSGEVLMHGSSTTVGYNVPSPEYVEYIKKLMDPAIDAGVKGIYLEEPEFWARAGWSEAFKKEYERFYHEPWRAPDSSPDAQYRTSKLKYELYFNALKDVFTYIKKGAKEKGIEIECHVPTHSLVNYAQWRIVSPQSHLADLPEFDGYIAQVWTGTARTENIYQGIRKERTFETAYFEYGQMLGMVRPTGRKVWFLADPIEDNPNKSWEDYKRNYEATIIASLMHPEVHRFEVMPWPSRIFQRKYALTDADIKGGPRVGIPQAYANELMTVINALNDMEQTDIDVDSGTTGIGILISDTIMFQREAPKQSDPHMGGFFGLALPFLKAGIPLEVMQLENTLVPGSLDRYTVLVLSYEGQKPLKAAYHDALVQWVKDGGILIYADDGVDPYHHVREWWNDEGRNKTIPADDLFARLGVKDSGDEFQTVGDGLVHIIGQRPSILQQSPQGAMTILQAVEKALARKGLEFQTQNYIKIRRGPYIVVSTLDESVSSTPLTLEGSMINLFDHRLAVQQHFTVSKDQRALLYDLQWAKDNLPLPQVVAASTRIKNPVTTKDNYSFITRGPKSTQANIRVLLHKPPTSVIVDGAVGFKYSFEQETNILSIQFDNRAEAQPVQVVF